MNSTNRFLNRALLFVLGLLLLAAGASAMIIGLAPPWSQRWLDDLVGVWASSRDAIGSWTVDLPGVAGVPGVVVVLFAAVLLLVALLVIFMVTRGGGKTRDVLSVDADGGRTSVDRDVAEGVLAGALAERADVLSARTAAYLVRRERAIELVVTVRRGAPLGRVLSAAESAVGEWDALLGTRAPILVRLADRGWRDGLRARTRVR